METRRSPEAYQPISISGTLAYSALVLYTLHFVLQYFDVPVLSPQEYLWNAVVWMTPEALLLDAAKRKELRVNDMLSQRHAAKSDALRRMMGLGGNVILQSIPKGEGISMGAVSGMMRRASASLVGGRNVLVTSDAPAGLGNWDNSCYQNSVLQALSSLGNLRTWLYDTEPPNAESASTTNMSLQELITKLRDPSNNGKHIWTPAKLKNMSSWQQQDAQEYFSKIMDELDQEAAKASAVKVVKPGLEVALEDGKRLKKSVAEEHAPPARNPLEGLTAQRVSCTTCGFSEGFSMIPFNCLTVPLGPQHAYDLEDCLAEYTKSEDIEGVECRSCTLLHAGARLKQLDLPAELRDQIVLRLKAIQQALESDDFSDKSLKQDCLIPAKAFINSTKSREVRIGRAPACLTVHVNRSVFDEMTGMQRKNYAHVRYPLILDLSPWMLGSSGGPVRYRLSAVVTHYGRHENGHYICYRRHSRAQTHGIVSGDDSASVEECEESEKSWWRLSDEDVSTVTEDDALNQGGVFMLFYERLNEPDSPAAEGDEDIDAAAVPLPPDEGTDWELVRAEASSTATPSLATSTTESVMSDTDTDATDIEDIQDATPVVLPAPILKTASPVYTHPAQQDMKHGLGMTRSLMSV